MTRVSGPAGWGLRRVCGFIASDICLNEAQLVDHWSAAAAAINVALNSIAHLPAQMMQSTVEPRQSARVYLSACCTENAMPSLLYLRNEATGLKHAL